MRKTKFNTGIIILSLFALILAGTGCKSKQKLAAEQAAVAHAQQVEQAKTDLLEIINDNGSMTLVEKENRLNVIKGLNLNDSEVQDLITQADMTLDEIRKEQAGKLRADEEMQRFAALKNTVLSNLKSVANAGSFAVANSRIASALNLFASEDIPVLIIISQENGIKDYDRPTTIKKYLEYLKDVKKLSNGIENIILDNRGKITEIELIKK
ncbi:MAG: hypothetical protein GY834_05040 [Bacteroidetes bacterium]|nr:hypothetical protein [Bacteroidota bacterium]